MMDEFTEKLAEAMWQAESYRASGKPRRVDWVDASWEDRRAWLLLAEAVIPIVRNEVLEEAAQVADKSEAFERQMLAEAESEEDREVFRRGIFKAKNIAKTIRARKEIRE